MPIRLIATDIDHTLLTSGRVPHPHSAAAIKRAVARGIHVVLASGRYIPSIQGYARDLGLTGPFIGSNGAHICGVDGTDIEIRSLNTDVLNHVLDYACKNNIHTNVYTDRFLYICSDKNPAGQISVDRSGTVKLETIGFAQARKLAVVKVMLIDQAEAIQAHQKVFAEKLQPDLTHLTTSEPEYLEFLPANCNKGMALKRLANQLGIAQHETAAIGDYMNDLEMIQWAGVGAAVGNAIQELKMAADVVVKSNDEGGVGQFIDSLLENQRE